MISDFATPTKRANPARENLARGNLIRENISMAWRIDTAVLRGEIDNRTRGRVTGRIWFVGRTEPVILELEGNSWRNLAGRKLEFINPQPESMELQCFAGRQRGSVGDITASRRVRVPEIPMDQVGEYYAARKPFPWHWGNSLYLEWFSQRNGRVVIESAAFELKIDPEAAWEMAPEEETTQREKNGAAMTGFMDRLANALEAQAESDDFNTGAEEETDEK
jgi:hypothetical protein